MAAQESSIADVMKSAIQDAQELVRSEIALAKMELRHEVRQVGGGVAMLAGGAVAGLITLVFLLTTIAWAISEVLAWPVWAGFGIVTAVMALMAAALAWIGRRKLSNGGRRMPLTVDTLKENMQWMRARTS
jgi:hypothetical protein